MNFYDTNNKDGGLPLNSLQKFLRSEIGSDHEILKHISYFLRNVVFDKNFENVLTVFC